MCVMNMNTILGKLCVRPDYHRISKRELNLENLTRAKSFLIDLMKCAFTNICFSSQ